MTKLNHNMNLQDAMEFVENKKAIFEAKSFKERVLVFIDTLGYRCKIRARMFAVWIKSTFLPNEVQSTGIMCGFNVASGKVRITILMKNGDEVSADYSVGGARAVADDIMRCVNAVDIGIKV